MYGKFSSEGTVCSTKKKYIISVEFLTQIAVASLGELRRHLKGGGCSLQAKFYPLACGWLSFFPIFFGRLLLQGCPLIAIHKVRYYKRGDGLALGPGPFVSALEYASDTRAEVVGKPEPMFFQQALQDLGCAAENAVMIGDVSIPSPMKNKWATNNPPPRRAIMTLFSLLKFRNCSFET